MKTILISGASGFIAQNFINKFKHDYKFMCLSHNKLNNNHITLDELTATPTLLNNVDIILNLAGANIGAQKWTTRRKQELLDSRIITTTKLVELANKYNKNIHFICASAIGVYPNDQKCDEKTVIDHNAHTNFSQEITRKWELAAQKYQGKLTITRFGVVLSALGGAFPKMLQPFKFYLGGKIGSGQQYFSWISLIDLLNALKYIINNTADGVYNLTSPQPLTNQSLSELIAKTWQRPNLIPLPEYMVKLIFGQMGEELFLNSLEVIPYRLINEGFKFTYPNFASCIKQIHLNKI